MAKQKTPAAAPAATNVLYILTEKGEQLAGKTSNTLQRPEKDKKYGIGWRNKGVALEAGNLRAASALALQELGTAFSEQEFAQVVEPYCRSATAKSRFTAFLKAGYIAEATAE